MSVKNTVAEIGKVEINRFSKVLQKIDSYLYLPYFTPPILARIGG
jgi:hypothetical protein